MFPALASEHHVALLPFLLDGVAGHAELNQGDGVHPNDVGEKIVASDTGAFARAQTVLLR